MLGYGEAPSAGPSKGTTGSRTPKEPEERKHQFVTWYIFAAFLGLMLVQFLWLRFTRVDTIPYSQFEELLDANKIAEVLVGQETVQGTLKEPFPRTAEKSSTQSASSPGSPTSFALTASSSPAP